MCTLTSLWCSQPLCNSPMHCPYSITHTKDCLLLSAGLLLLVAFAPYSMMPVLSHGSLFPYPSLFLLIRMILPSLIALDGLLILLLMEREKHYSLTIKSKLMKPWRTSISLLAAPGKCLKLWNNGVIWPTM